MSERVLRPVIWILEALLVGMAMAWVLDLPSIAGIELYTEQFLSAALGVTLALAFLKIPGTKRSPGQVPWYDLVAGAVGLLCCWYIAVRYPVLVTQLVYRPPDGIAVATAIVLLVIEATRRTAGITLVLVVLVLCVYAMVGYLLPGAFATRPVDLSRLVVYLGVDTDALLGKPLEVGLIVLVPFIVMGQILSRCGGADYFTDLSMALMGRYRGGAAKIAVVGSALFGMISGSAVANVAGVGVVTIPLMKRAGFPPQIAASIEAVGSTGGQLMPPVMGAAAFLMAEYLQIPYSAVMIAAVVPSLLYYSALFIQVDLEAAKRGIAGAPVDGLPHVGEVLRRGWYFPIPFALLILGLVAWNMEAEYAALIASAVLLVFAMTFGYRGKRLSVGQAIQAVVSSGGAIVDLVIITAAAGLVIGVLNLTGLAFGLTLQLLAVSGHSLGLLLLMTAAVGIVLGMGMPTVGVYIILATLAAPALIQAGILPLQAHMFVMYFGLMSMVTPPVALAAFAAANLAQVDPWRTGWTAVRIGWCAYIVPFLFALSPSLLLQGSAVNAAISTVTALLGVWFGSSAVVGYMRGPLAPLTRVVYAVIGLSLLIPTDMFHGALLLNAVAFVAACGALLWERSGGRQKQKVLGKSVP